MSVQANEYLGPVDASGVSSSGSSSAAGLTIETALSATAYDLNSASYSGVTSVSDDYLLSQLLIKFSTASSRDITVTAANGTVLYSTTGNSDSSIAYDFNDIGFNGGDNVTVAITQTAGACTATLSLTIKRGTSTLLADPVIGAGSNLIGKVNTIAEPYTTRIDEASATVTYIGKATPGTATSAASWRIKKIDESSGTVITWAGSASFNQIWDNRAVLVYA